MDWVVPSLPDLRCTRICSIGSHCLSTNTAKDHLGGEFSTLRSRWQDVTDSFITYRPRTVCGLFNSPSLVSAKGFKSFGGLKNLQKAYFWVSEVRFVWKQRTWTIIILSWCCGVCYLYSWRFMLWKRLDSCRVWRIIRVSLDAECAFWWRFRPFSVIGSADPACTVRISYSPNKLREFYFKLPPSPPRRREHSWQLYVLQLLQMPTIGYVRLLIEYLLECCRGKGLFLLNEQEVLFGRRDVALIWGLSVTSTAMKETSVQVFPRKVFPKDKAHQLSIYRSGRILREVHRQDKSWRWGGLPV